jgi:hypothetical protein
MKTMGEYLKIERKATLRGGAGWPDKRAKKALFYLKKMGRN